ncbi:hypothetical protein B7P43_G10812 [Cryptotermes secundus]|uniref:Uncharacterized protein n=1 Tax=Cryptotermes secundus TaxID=105785 RepID=A0A2J7RRN2_9NEOP|nr:hypothetical protein B7P43_G10812 [Cryptotermes secundus]
MRGYQPSSNLMKDENGDLLADSHNILNMWKNYYSQLLNVHRVSDFRQTEIHTAELLVPNPSPFEVESAIAKLKRYKSPGSDQILPELIQAGGKILCSKIHKLITSIWHKEKLPDDQWKESIIVPVHKKGDKTDCSNYCGMSLIQVSQEEWTKLREGVPYVKVCRYNPKHLCPKLNSYGDNGPRKVWSSGRSMHYTCQLRLLSVCP